MTHHYKAANEQGCICPLHFCVGIQPNKHAFLGQRTQRRRCPIEQRGAFPSVRGEQALSKGRRGLAWGEGAGGGWTPGTRSLGPG